jgi:anti-sigma factor RsiW
MTPLTCSELVELVTDFLEDALPEDVRERFEAHLAGCEDCTAYVEQVRETVRLAGRLDGESLDAETCDELLAHFRGLV